LRRLYPLSCEEDTAGVDRKHIKIGDQESLIEEVIGFVREKLKTSPRSISLSSPSTNAAHLLDANPESLTSGKTKNELADRLRDEFRQKDIIRYAFISECWVSRIAPAPPGPVTCEYLDHHLATYHDAYQKRELSPRKGGGRE
jgi:hypothetical protein